MFIITDAPIQGKVANRLNIGQTSNIDLQKGPEYTESLWRA